VLMNRTHGNPETQRFHIPCMMNKMLEHLQVRGKCEDGILRIAGSREEADTAKRQFDSGNAVDLYNTPIHVIGDLIKSFIREIPGSLFDIRRLDDWLALAGIESLADRTDAIAKLVSKLDAPRRALICVLFSVLFDLTKSSVANRMTCDNMAKVITPTVMALHDCTFDQHKIFAALNLLTGIVETMIEHHAMVFGAKPHYTLQFTINMQKASKLRGGTSDTRKIKKIVAHGPSGSTKTIGGKHICRPR